jgi:diguanylate cyclase (GGDEF)-like protein
VTGVSNNDSAKPVLYGAWYNSTSKITTVRLSLVLVLATLVFLPAASPDIYQLIGLLAVVVGYASLVSLVLLLKTSSLTPPRLTIYISLLMLVFISAATGLLERDAVALLVVIPVLNAALRLAGRQLMFVVLLAGVCSLGLKLQTGLSFMHSYVEVISVWMLLILVAVIVRSLRSDMDQARSRITALSYQDELSGTLNMRTFTKQLLAIQAKALETDTSYALIMIDIENLQIMNEKYGHEQGNRVIVAVAEALQRSIQADDLIARYGGDEFMVYVAGADNKIAQETSNRITQNVYNITLLFDSKMQRVQVNAGIAVYPDNASTIQEMMAFADKAMYRDKEFRRQVKPSGSNREASRTQAGIELL